MGGLEDIKNEAVDLVSVFFSLYSQIFMLL